MFLHVDMDAFFVSVELIKRPDLRGRPVAVCPGGRGVVLSPTYEARARGVRTAMPLARARDLCPELVILPPHHEHYEEAAARLRDLFGEYSDRVEPFSIDEAFLDMSHMPAEPGVAARDIRRRVRAEHGLTCSIGVAPSRRLAKLAGKLMKPDGLVEVTDDAPEMFLMEILPPRMLAGIGPKTAESLARRGLRTLGQVLRAAPAAIVEPAALGTGVQSIGHGRTFERDLADREELARRLLAMAMDVGRRARELGVRGRTVVLGVRYADFTTISRRRGVAVPLQDGLELHRVGLSLLDTLDDPRPIRRLSISLAHLAKEDGDGLLPKEERWRRAARALDAIRARFGDDSMTLASLA